jgi:RNA polymerase sigma factor (sigma-70 family)
MNAQVIEKTDATDGDPTRESLLERLHDINDQEGWRVFFDRYWRLIYNSAIKSGLNDAEAQDVVQETVIRVCRQMPGFEYDRSKGSFKNWLLTLTSWRIGDQFRRRQRGVLRPRPGAGTATGTADLDDVPDPLSLRLDDSWEEDWKQTLLDAALEKVKLSVDPRQYQVFDLYAVKHWPVSKVAKTLKVSRAKVYLIKHRISGAIKKEVVRLQQKPI